MLFDKGYLIKSVSAVTNYNSSSCYFWDKTALFIGFYNGTSNESVNIPFL